MFGIFYVFVFCMPFLKLSVPAFGAMEVTVSDLCMIFLAFVSLTLIKRVSTSFVPYMLTFCFFNFAILLSFVYAKNSFIFFRDFFPNIFAGLIMITSMTFFSIGDKVKRLNTIRWMLLASFFISGLPAYFETFSGVRLDMFYDKYGWRYTFLAQNPNQYGVSSILFVFLIVMIDLMFSRKNLKYDLLVILYGLVPMLYSGSRTSILGFSVVSLVVLFYLFTTLRISSKILVAPIIAILLVVGVVKSLEFMKGKGGQINRALSIFEKIEKGENLAEIEGGTGASINEALRLLKSYPLVGVGIGNKIAYSQKKTEIHNTYLKFLAETGIVGFIGFLSIFLFPLWAMMTCKTARFNKLIYLGFFLIFAAMNYPHMLFRQRWVWFFMIVSFILAKVANEEYDGQFPKTNYIKAQ